MTVFGGNPGSSFIQGVRFRAQELFFWPYQALPGLTELDKRRPVTRVTRVAPLPWLHSKGVNWVDRLIELIGLIGCDFFHVRRVVAVLLSRRSWRGQPVHTTTLYIPTKCQIVRGGERARDSVGGSCEELTVSNHCQIWVTYVRETMERSRDKSGEGD